jgi:hypothetical protein
MCTGIEEMHTLIKGYVKFVGGCNLALWDNPFDRTIGFHATNLNDPENLPPGIKERIIVAEVMDEWPVDSWSVSLFQMKVDMDADLHLEDIILKDGQKLVYKNGVLILTSNSP